MISALFTFNPSITSLPVYSAVMFSNDFSIPFTVIVVVFSNAVISIVFSPTSIALSSTSKVSTFDVVLLL